MSALVEEAAGSGVVADDSSPAGDSSSDYEAYELTSAATAVDGMSGEMQWLVTNCVTMLEVSCNHRARTYPSDLAISPL